MTTRYRLDPDRGRFTVQAFATGMLSYLGIAHSPTFAVRGYRGEVHLDGVDPGSMTIDLVVDADSLALVDRGTPADRREIEERMRRDVLEPSIHPESRYAARGVRPRPTAPGRFLLALEGHLSLHGVTRPHAIDAELRIHDDALQLAGVTPVAMSAFQIRPVTALGGGIKLRDDVRVSFDLVAVREGP
jgi:polyisoprenoid-binding protein YceI